MGLKERRFTQEFIANSFPALQNEINQAAGFSVPLEISWVPCLKTPICICIMILILKYIFCR